MSRPVIYRQGGAIPVQSFADGQQIFSTCSHQWQPCHYSAHEDMQHTALNNESWTSIRCLEGVSGVSAREKSKGPGPSMLRALA